MVVFTGGRRDDADNIITKGRVVQIEQTAIDACGAGNLPLLAQVNIGFGRGEPIGGAGLDLDEAEHRPIVSDQINLGVNQHVAAIASHRQLEVSRDEAKADTLQILRRQLLAALSEREMRREFRRFALDNDCSILKNHAAKIIAVDGRMRLPVYLINHAG